VLVAEAAEQLHGGMPLLRRGVFVLGEDLVDGGVERPEDRGGPGLGPGVGDRLGLAQDAADLGSGVMEGAGDLADGHAIATSPADGAVIVHRKHILPSVGVVVSEETSTLREGAAVGPN
jgi:hypothetical protein